MISRSVIDKYELEKLEGLRKSQENQVAFEVNYREELKEELRRLLALGFIERQPEHGFRTLEKTQGKTNLAEHFRITEEGNEYLRLREKLGIQPIVIIDEEL